MAHPDDEEAAEARRTRGLWGFVVVLLLALAASYVVEDLRREGNLEDCLLAGRTNCDSLIERR